MRRVPGAAGVRPGDAVRELLDFTLGAAAGGPSQRGLRERQAQSRVASRHRERWMSDARAWRRSLLDGSGGVGSGGPADGVPDRHMFGGTLQDVQVSDSVPLRKLRSMVGCSLTHWGWLIDHDTTHVREQILTLTEVPMNVKVRFGGLIAARSVKYLGRLDHKVRCKRDSRAAVVSCAAIALAPALRPVRGMRVGWHL